MLLNFPTEIKPNDSLKSIVVNQFKISFFQKKNNLQQDRYMSVPETSRSTVIGSIENSNRQEQKAGTKLLHKEGK